MNYKIPDVEKSFEGKIVENLGNNDYVIKINDKEHQLRILNMDAKGIEFILDQQYHKAKYLETLTNEMNLVIDHVPIVLNMNTHFDEVVFKNSGGGGAGGVVGQQIDQLVDANVTWNLTVSETNSFILIAQLSLRAG